MNTDVDDCEATKTRYLVGTFSGGCKRKSRRKGLAGKRPIVYLDFSDSDDPEAGYQFQSPGQQNEPTAEAAYFSDTEALSYTGEPLTEIINLSSGQQNENPQLRQPTSLIQNH